MNALVDMADAKTIKWLCRQYTQTGRAVARLGTTDNHYVADMVGYGRLWVRRDTKQSRFEWRSKSESLQLDKFSKHTLAALIGHAHGEVALHGSAIAMGEKAIGFVGRSGVGKSTTAASICLNKEIPSSCLSVSMRASSEQSAAPHGFAERGELLSDDIVAFDIDGGGAWALPQQDAIWLNTQSLRSLGLRRGQRGRGIKVPVELSARAALAPRLLHAMVALRFDDRLRVPRLDRLSGHGAFYMLFSNIHRLVLNDSNYQRREVEALTALLRHVPVYLFRRPRNLKHVREESAALVRAILGA